MYSLVYVSTASPLCEEEDLEKILTVSRHWNRRVEITGLLLYKHPNFMQFLEGRKDAVLEILGRIKSDPRHHSLIVLLQQEEHERVFHSWSMGFNRLLPDTPAPKGFNDLWELPFTSEQFLTKPSRCLQFLFSFKKSVQESDEYGVAPPPSK
jgi:hypothetical protein